MQLLQQFPDTITPAEEWIRQKVKVGRCSHTTTLKPLKSIFAAATTENEEQRVQFSWRIAGASEYMYPEISE